MKKYLFFLIVFPQLVLGQSVAISKKHKNGKRPKNIILMIGDGTGLAQWCAAMAAQDAMLSVFQWAKFVGLSLTSSADDWITDSAAGATAFSTGEKTNNKMISTAPDSSHLKTIFETLEEQKFKTGLVTTCALQHATPAAFYAHTVYRGNYTQIAKDFYTSGVDFAAGGGYPNFDSTLGKYYQYGFGIQSLVKQTYPSKYVVFYDSSQHPPAMHEGRNTDWLRNASIAAVTALDEKNKKGFLLMIEGSQIDWGGHNKDSNYVVKETIDFDKAIKTMMQWAAADGETLVIVTADHETGGLSLTHRDTAKSNVPRMQFSTGEHTGIAVPVFAFGPGAELFSGVYQNTELYYKMKNLLLKK